jgi:hypothetical protein
MDLLRNASWSFFTKTPNDEVKTRNLQKLVDSGEFKAYEFKKNLYDALRDLIDNLVNAYYDSDEQVEKDAELQAFAADASGFFNGRVVGFPSSFETRKQLIKTITYIHYLTAVRHHYMNSVATFWNYAIPWAPSSFCT